MGGAQKARAIRGEGWPQNWVDLPFGSQEVQAFLAGLDFFIHYPNETYIEEFGRAPMEAMAIGVPVILPPVFRETFGEAALYAEPNDVWATIEALWKDEAAYHERSEIGRAFVVENCNLDQFPRRLGIAAASPAAPVVS